MKISRQTKLLIIALVVSITAMVGSTLAWFTDSVESASNVITAGNLDIEVEYTLDGTAWKNLKDAEDLFRKSLWEPGHTEVAVLKLENKGSLAIEYTAEMNIVSETIGKTKDGADIKLSDILTVETCNFTDAGETADVFAAEDGVAYGAPVAFNAGNVLGKDQPLLPGETVYAAIKVDMAETVGNEANHNGTDIPKITFGVNVVALQLPHEEDSFGNQYDEYSDQIVIQEGSTSGINWKLTDKGTLFINPSDTATPDATCGKVFEPGQWREAVVYNSKGGAVAEGFNRPNATGDQGGYFVDRNAVKSLVIGEGVTYIGSFAAQFPNLTGEVVIPSTVTYIGQEAFKDAKIRKLTFAKVPEGQVGKELCIAHGAFKNLEIEEVVLPADRPVHLHIWTFLGCKNLKHVTFTDTITEMKGANHIDYFGNPNTQANPAWGNYSQIVGGKDNKGNVSNPALETVTFTSETVKNLFFKYADNKVGADTRYGVAYVVNEQGHYVYCTSLQVAVNVAKAGQTITLTSNTSESVKIPTGVTLDKNGYTADNVTE